MMQQLAYSIKKFKIYFLPFLVKLAVYHMAISIYGDAILISAFGSIPRPSLFLKHEFLIKQHNFWQPSAMLK